MNTQLSTNLQLTLLSESEYAAISGGGFWDVAEVVLDTAVRCSSLTGVFLVGLKNGLKEAINAEKTAK